MDKNGINRRSLLGSGLFLTVGLAGRAEAAMRGSAASSPDGTLQVMVGRDARWSVAYKGRPLLHPAKLGLRFADGRALCAGAKLVKTSRRSVHDRWEPPVGIRKVYDHAGEELTAEFVCPDGFRFDVILRAYDRGAALRYVVHGKAGQAGEIAFAAEDTHFRFPAGTTVYASRDEGDFYASTPEAMGPVSDPLPTPAADAGGCADLPVTAILSGGIAALIAESDRLHYPRAMLRAADGAKGELVTHTMRYPGRANGPAGPDNPPPEPVFSLRPGQATPWRVVLVGANENELLENADLIPTLATPNILGDVSWVKPGRVIRLRMPYTTEAGMELLDFAERHKLEYIEVDWHWYGNGTDDSDATVPIPGFDIQKIVAAGRARGIGTILYVDREPIKKQLLDIVKTYQAWGVAGIKFGFVWEGTQQETDFLYEAVKVCGEHKLLVDLHDDLRPAGLERTLPNYITLEGVRGNEHFPTAKHNVTLPFTRNVAGPADYTICYAQDRNRTTNAHQLALAAILYSPVMFLYWYDSPQKYAAGEWPELKWFDECPADWDETRALAGKIGEYAIVARRKGPRWFVGAATDESGRSLRLPLKFLGPGVWNASIYADGAETAPAYKTPVVISERQVTAADVLDLKLNAAGGQALLFTPAA
jgi:alpha-glucosidase